MGVPRTGFPRALKRLYDYLDGVTTQDDGDVLVGAIPAVTGLSVSEEGSGALRRTVLTFTDMAVALVDEPGVVAYKGTKVYDMPAGLIQIFGAVLDVVITKSSAGVIATADGDTGVGTVTASNDATLAATEQDIIPTTAWTQMVDGATTLKTHNAAAIAPIVAGLTTDVDIFLNNLVDDTDHDVTTTPCNLIINGTLVLTWANLGNH